MKKQTGYTLTELMVVVVALIGGYGWVMNVVTIVHQAQGGITESILLIILRVIGIFAFPLGCLLGFL